MKDAKPTAKKQSFPEHSYSKSQVEETITDVEIGQIHPSNEVQQEPCKCRFYQNKIKQLQRKVYIIYIKAIYYIIYYTLQSLLNGVCVHGARSVTMLDLLTV